MSEVKVSIIVPIHNSESYLHKCVNSCLAQTLKEIEIILVDDASGDSSPSKIAEYASAFPDKVVAVYLKENLRQGGARNRGIELAKGEYIAFVDSDDWIEPDMCEELYLAAKSNDADMAGGNCYISTYSEDAPKQLGYQSVLLGQENKDALYEYLQGQGYFWNRIYRKSMLVRYEIFFPEKLFYEDAYFNFLTALRSNKVVKVDKCFYHYFQSENSTIRVRNNGRAYNRIEIARMIISECRRVGLYQSFPDIIENKFISMSASNILYTCLGGFDEPELTKIECIRADMKEFCPQYKTNPYYSNLSDDLKWYLNAAMISPSFAIWSYKHGANRLLGYVQIIKQKIFKRRGLQ